MERVLSTERYTDSQAWYVIFDRTRRGNKWWEWFLHRDFQHVHAVRELGDSTLMVNSFLHCMAIRQYPCSIFNFIQQELAQDPTAVLMYTVHYGAHYKPMPFDMISCVSVIKRLLCVRSRLITPKQLYHELVRAGATVIKPYCVV